MLNACSSKTTTWGNLTEFGETTLNQTGESLGHGSLQILTLPDYNTCISIILPSKLV